MPMPTSGHPEKLYKYRAGNSLDLDALSTDYIYAAPPTSLNDPFEVRVRLDDTEFAIVDLLASSVASKLSAGPLRSFLVNFIETLRCGGICSFSATPRESRRAMQLCSILAICASRRTILSYGEAIPT